MYLLLIDVLVIIMVLNNEQSINYPSALVALPHDYGLYNINFYEDNKCHIAVCGAGSQSMSLEVSGKYKFIFNDDGSSGQLHIKLIRNISHFEIYAGTDPDPDNSDEKDINVNFKIEQGIFYLGNETLTSWKDKIVMAKEKYIFEHDPVAMLRILAHHSFLYEDINLQDSWNIIMKEYQGTRHHTFYVPPFRSNTAQKLSKQDIDFTNNGYFKFKFDNFGYITDYNKEVYEELIGNCDYVDDLAYDDGYIIEENENFSNKVMCDNIITRSNKKSNSKILSNGATEMIVYYNKDLDTIGYYILENTGYYDKDAGEDFSLICIHAMETVPKKLVDQPTDYDEDNLTNDMVDSMYQSINDEWRSPQNKLAIILPDYLEGYFDKFEHLGFVKAPVYRSDIFKKKYQYKIDLYYEELIAGGYDDFDKATDTILWNTSIVDFTN